MKEIDAKRNRVGLRYPQILLLLKPETLNNNFLFENRVKIKPWILPRVLFIYLGKVSAANCKMSKRLIFEVCWKD